MLTRGAHPGGDPPGDETSHGAPALVASQIALTPKGSLPGDPADHTGGGGRADAASAPSSARWLARTWAFLRRWESSFALLLISTVYSTVQGATQNIIGVDGYYHIKVALLMREQGWRLLAPLDFPWLQLTILGPGRYSDHHFLFHVLQAPFTFGDPRVGAKMAAVLLAVLALYTTYGFMSQQKVRYPVLWIAAILALAPVFLWRQSMARTQSLSLTLIVFGLWALFAGRIRLLVIVGFLAAWLFNGFFFVLGAPAAAVVASLGSRMAHRWWLRPADAEAATTQALTPPLSFALSALGWTLLGIGIGLLTHPYFPRNIEFAFFHLLPKAVPAEQASVSVGQEWYPYTFNGFLVRVGPTMTLALVGLVPLAVTLWRRRWPEWRTLVLAMLAMGFLAMVAASQRIIEYFPAIGVIFCAWSLSHAAGEFQVVSTRQFSVFRERWATRFGQADGAPTLAHLGRLARPARAVAPVLIFCALLPFIVSSAVLASRQAGEGLPWTTYRDGALWLKANTPAGSRVFTTGWDDFPHMFYWNTHNVYLVGLDPTYMSLEDPKAWALWRSITQGRTPNPSGPIREQFQSSYVLTDMLHARFLQVATADPGLEEVFRSPTVVVFRVRGE